MLPDKNDPMWEKLITGKIEHNFKQVSAGMMLSRMQRMTKTPELFNVEMSDLIEEVYSFFEKFENLLEEDIKKIF